MVSDWLITQKKPPRTNQILAVLTIKNHRTGEILIADMCEIGRRDRGSDPHGGVFIAVKNDLIASRERELQTACGVMWCKLQIFGKKTLHIGAYYKPHENDKEALLELEGSL